MSVVLQASVRSLGSLKELRVKEQFLNVADKELLPLLKKRFKTLKKVATWADDHVLARRQVPQTGSWDRGDGGPR